MSDNHENNNNDRNNGNVDNSANKSDINNGRDARSNGYGDYGENSVIDENMQDNFINNNSKLANNGQNDMSGLSSDQNTDNVSAMENSDKTKGSDGNASQTAQTAKDAKTAEDNAKDAKDTAKDAASEASDAASDAAGKGKVMTAFNVTDNLKASAQEAEGLWHDWKERCRAYGEEQTELSRQRRLIMKEEEEYEHSGLWGRKPVFDFSRRGHHLEQHREELEDREDRLEEEWYDLQKEYKGYCNRVLDICDELCDYVIVLMDCLEEEKQSNIRNGEKLEADYEAGHEDIRRLDEEYERARHVLDTLTSLGGTEDGV